MKEQVHKLIRNTAVTLRKSVDRSNRLFVFFQEPFGGEMEVCWPLKSVPKFAPASLKLVQTCLRRERTVQVHDSVLDPVTKAVDKDFRAALCVPLFDKDKTCMGVIYLDCTEVGVFEKEQRLHVERLARKMSTRIPRWTKANLKQHVDTNDKFPKFDFRTVGTILGASVFFILSWTFAPADPVPQPTPGVSGVPAARILGPEDVSRSYLALLSLRESEQILTLLAPSLRERLSEKEISNQITTWFSDQERRWEFGKRKVRLIEKSRESATVSVDPGVKEDVLKSWTVGLSLIEDEWKIVSLKRGPIKEP